MRPADQTCAYIGVASLNAFEKLGIDTAIGLDEAGINDDRDILQEMRMVLRAHRVPGMEDGTSRALGRVLRMATAGGAATTPYGSHIGILAVGKAGDLVLLDWDKLAYPYLDQETPVVEPVLQRAKSEGVDLVMVAGEVVYEGGRFIRVDRDAALRELHASLQDARSPTTRSSGGSCRRRSSPMCGASTPAISIPTLTCPTIVRARGLTGECRSKLLRGSR